MRICITGRSHMAALRNAVTEHKIDPAPHDITFIGAGSKQYAEEVDLREGVLLPRGNARQMFLLTSDGQYDHLDPLNFDAVVVYGTSVHLMMLFRSIMMAQKGDAVRFSTGFIRNGARHWLDAQPVMSRIAAMSARSGIPILLMLEPFFSEIYRTKLPKNARITPETRAAAYSGIHDAAASIGIGCLFQPEDTITETIFSRQQYGVGSRRLTGSGEEHELDDFTHLNSTYGAIALARILDHFASAR